VEVRPQASLRQSSEHRPDAGSIHLLPPSCLARGTREPCVRDMPMGN
jgi:hypothetical protein